MLEKVYHNIIDTFSISEIVWFENDGSLLVCDAHCIEIDIYFLLFNGSDGSEIGYTCQSQFGEQIGILDLFLYRVYDKIVFI